MGSSSGLGRPRGAGPAAAICVVDILTTIGWSFFASVTKSGGLLDAREPRFAKNPSEPSVPLSAEPSVPLPEQPNPMPIVKNSMKTIAALGIFLYFHEK